MLRTDQDTKISIVKTANSILYEFAKIDYINWKSKGLRLCEMEVQSSQLKLKAVWEMKIEIKNWNT